MELKERIRITRDALIGQAAGDAFGVPVEFLSRAEVRAVDPKEMLGKDTEPRIDSRWGSRIPRGSWSDDTSMTIASMASFIRKGGQVDCADQLDRFLDWWDRSEYCCLAYPFGLGGNVDAALRRWKAGTPAEECGGKGEMDNGNGALMRILPFSLYCIFGGLDAEETVKVSGTGSAITHGHETSRMCCFIWTEFLRAIACGAGTDGAVAHIEGLPYRQWFSEEAAGKVRYVTEKRVRSLEEEAIGETGYVVDTLYTALYSLCRADSYEGCIRTAVGLGYDTDTAAAVCGTAAGILYGTEGIPARWLEVLRKRTELETLAKAFAECVGAEKTEGSDPADRGRAV